MGNILGVRPLQSDALGLLNLDDLRIVNDDLHDTETQRGDLTADQFNPPLTRPAGSRDLLILSFALHLITTIIIVFLPIKQGGTASAHFIWIAIPQFHQMRVMTT